MGSACRFPCVLPIPLLSDPPFSDPSNLLSEPLIVLTLQAQGRFTSAPPPLWPGLGWWRLVAVVSADLLFRCFWFSGPTSGQSFVKAYQGLSFWHQNSIPKSCFFKTPYCTPFVFQAFCWFYNNMVGFGTPSKFSGRTNRIQNLPFSPTCHNVRCFFFGGEGFSSRPAFPKIIEIIVPFGPSGL